MFACGTAFPTGSDAGHCDGRRSIRRRSAFENRRMADCSESRSRPNHASSVPQVRTRRCVELLSEPDSVEKPDGVGTDINAGPKLGEFRRLFVDLRFKTLPAQRDGRRQSSEARANDGNAARTFPHQTFLRELKCRGSTGNHSYLDLGRPDHSPPFLGLADDRLTIFGRRERGRRGADGGELSFHLGIGQAGIDSLIKLLDDGLRCTLRRTNAAPRRRLVTGHGLAHGRNIGEQR